LASNETEKLLRFIVQHYLARQHQVEIDLDASAADSGADIAEDKRRAVEVEDGRIDQLADAFEDGLQRAESARRVGGSAVSLDDRKAADNQQADALVNFLVRSKLATSHTRETDEHRYIYTIAIDWEALDRVARDARVNLANILDHG
jgi:hypothetical protein